LVAHAGINGRRIVGFTGEKKKKIFVRKWSMGKKNNTEKIQKRRK